MTGNLDGRFNGGTNGGFAQIGGRGRSLATIAIDSDAEGAILIEFNAFQFTTPGVHRQPGLLADGDFGQRGAQSFGYLQGFGNHGLEMGLILADLVLLIHNSHLYERRKGVSISDPCAQREKLVTYQPNVNDRNQETDESISRRQRVRRLGPQQEPAQARCRSIAENGEEIVSLSHSELEKIPLDEELAEAVELGRKLKPKKDESFRRHLQFIGRLMRSRDIEPIAEALSIIKNRHSTVNARLHRLEQWRERLITEGDSALNELMSQFHELDRQKLRQLIRSANKERS